MKTIPLTQDQVALVDDEDYERLNAYKWFAAKHGHAFYAARRGPNRRLVYAHHEILGKPRPGFEVDHVDGISLNNQRFNLRWVTYSQNQMNQHRIRGRSQYKGVHWIKKTEKWQVRIQLDGVRNHLGYFDSEEDAARAYDAASLHYFGEFARPNFPVGNVYG